MTPVQSVLKSYRLSTLLAALAHPPAPVTDAARSTDASVCRVCCDSREADATALFVCIRGSQSDGHDYIPAAYAAGCRAFLVQHPTSISLPSDAAVFVSDNTRRDLALLVAEMYGHPSHDLQVVGITGTKGKTTVALMCHHILKKQGVSSGYIGTCGISYGDVERPTRNTTPDALELQATLSDMQNSSVRVVLLEVSSQALWQHRVDGVSFAACALTNLYPDHVGTSEHPDLAHYAACKRRLFTEFAPPVIVANADDEAAEALLEGILTPMRFCGRDKRACLTAEDYRIDTQSGVPGARFTCLDRQSGERMPVSLPFPGEYNVQNALLALEIVRSLGVSLKDAAAALADVRIPGRFEMMPYGGALVVIDYAHNAAALRAALTALRPLARGRLICLFGSVGDRTQCRRAAMGEVADALSDYVYLTADDPGHEPVEDICRDIAAAFSPTQAPRYTVIPDRAEAIRTALCDLKEGDVLLLAGKGDERVQRIGDQQIAHRDRDVVEQYFHARSLRI